MPPFIDKTEAITKPKTARMEQRTKPHVKAEIQTAAALIGMDETAFVTGAAYERARAVIEDHERSRLAAEDRNLVLAALDRPAEPTEALRAALDLHRNTVVHEER